MSRRPASSSNTTNTTTGSNANLVHSWLHGIGLSNVIIANMEAAGIVTPSALSELEVSHFEMLGIDNPEDRRKLFFLIQRIRLEQQKNSHTNNTQQLIDTVMAKTTSITPPTTPQNNNKRNHSTTTTVVVVDTLSPESFASAMQHPDDEDDEEIGNNDPDQQQRLTPKRGNHTNSYTTTIPKRMTRSMARAANQQQQQYPLPPQADIAGGSTDKKPATNPKQPPPTRTTLRKSASDVLDEALNSNIINNNYPEKPNNGSTHSSTEYSVILDEVLKDDADYDDDDEDHKMNEESHMDTSREKKTRTTSMARSSQQQQPKAIPKTTTMMTTSKLPVPKSNRTGKPLSVIPSESIPPMSPLIDLNLQASSTTSSLKATTTSSEQQQKEEEPLQPRRRRSLSTNARNRRNSTSSLHSDTNDEDARSVGSSNSQQRRQSFMPPPTKITSNCTTPTRKGRSSFTRSRSTSTVSMASSVTSYESNGVNNNWKAQIERLREINTEEHEVLYGTVDDSYAADDQENDDDDTMRIRVVVRKRPMNSDAAGEIDIVHAIPCRIQQQQRSSSSSSSSFGKILVYQPKTRVDLTKTVETIAFAVDDVYDEHSDNARIYQRSVRNLIPGLFQGQWGSVFAYGQTGSGKTFTMMGDRNCTTSEEKTLNDIYNFGLYYMAALDIFHAIQHTPSLGDLCVSISLFEIYGGKLFDLLNSRAAVKCLEDSRGQVRFPGLSHHRVESPDALLQLIEVGNAQRSTGTTSRNADSSRSHAVLQIHIFKQQQRQVRTTKSSSSSSIEEEFSRLTFIDLAGSERGVDTASSSRATRLEGAEINTSLLALKEVIRALAVGGGAGDNALAHVPFRGSKLTQVLKQSFVGKNCRSVMIACISPNIGNCEQTLNTLRYADRVKERNATTGELNRRQSSKIEQQHPRSLTAKSMSPLPNNSKNSQFTNLARTVEFSRASSSNHSMSNTSDVLDDLLASPESGSDIEEFMQDGLDHQQIVDDLVETHKDVVSVMLDMVQEEMMLVNAADSNRQADCGSVLDGSYMAQVQKIQEEQLAMITLLREQLSQYRLSLGEAARPRHADKDMHDLLRVGLNDSYVEDLRFD